MSVLAIELSKMSATRNIPAIKLAERSINEIGFNIVIKEEEKRSGMSKRLFKIDIVYAENVGQIILCGAIYYQEKIELERFESILLSRLAWNIHALAQQTMLPCPMPVQLPKKRGFNETCET